VSINNETTYIQIPTGPNVPIVYLGPNSSVTSSNGLACGPGSKIQITGAYGTSIYGITAAGATTVTWLAGTT
jgi:hypothetical protein